MSLPLVTVIIPTFNRASYVGHAIESVLRQTYKDLEVIVVDDGSTDDTAEVLKRFEHKIQVLRQTNSGVSAARNQGLKRARGSWIAFLDSDDEWHQDKLRIQMGQLEARPTAIGHMCNAVYLQANGTGAELFKLRRYQPAGNPQLEKKPFGLILEHSLASLQCSVLKRETISRAGGFDPAFAIYEDLDLLLRVARHGDFVFDQTILASIIRREESAGLSLTARATGDGIKRYGVMLQILENLMRDPSLQPSELDALQRFASSYCFLLAMACAQAGEKSLSKSALRKSWHYHPSVKAGLKFSLGLLPLGLGPKLHRAITAG